MLPPAGRRASRSPTSSTAAPPPRFFLALVERSLTRREEGLYRWLGEQHAQQGTGPTVRPDGYGRYLLPDGEIAFYLEIDRGSESTRRVKTKLDAYRQALAADPHRDRGNILLVCEGRRRLANLARCAPPGPPWVWGTTDRERYTLLPGRDQQRTFTRAARRTSPRRPPRHRLPRAPLAPPRPRGQPPHGGRHERAPRATGVRAGDTAGEGTRSPVRARASRRRPLRGRAAPGTTGGLWRPAGLSRERRVGRSCQSLEIAAGIWSDRRNP